MANGITDKGARIKRLTGTVVTSTGGFYNGTRVIPIADYDFTTGVAVAAGSGTAGGRTTDGRRIQAVALTEGTGRYVEKYDWNTGALADSVTTAPVNSVVPSISGIQTKGQTLSASTGTWSQSPTSYAYQWKRAGADISGALSSTYVLVTADVGTAITVAVVASNVAFGAGTAAPSSATNAIADTLSISGTPGATATVGVAYSFTPSTAGGHTPKTYGLTGTLPAGLSFSTSTGAITGTPTGAQVASGLAVSVVDVDLLSASLATFSITVTAAAPSLTFAASNTTVSGSTFTPTLPSGTGRVFVPVSCPSNTALSTASTGWKRYKIVPNGAGLCCTWFQSTAGDANPGALVVTSAAATLFSTVAIRSDHARTRFIISAPVIGTAANANPNSVDQIASRQTTFLTVLTLAGTGVASAGPSGYSGLTTQAGFTAGASTCVAAKAATASIDDPGAWTHASAAYVAQTVALVDGGATWADDWKAAANGLAANGVNVPVLFWGDSLVAGMTHATTGASANQIATARPALFAAGLTTGPASSRNWLGVGGANVTSNQLFNYDNRRTVGTGWDHSRTGGQNTLGGGFLTGATSGQDMSFTPGGSWNRYRVLKAQYPASPEYTARVDAGGTTTLTMNAANGVTWSPAITGSGTAIKIGSTGASGFILATETYTFGTPQISVFNGGWFGSTSTQNAEVANFYSPPYAATAVGAKLTSICIGSNDPGAAVTTDQTEYNIQTMALVGMVSGSVCIETPPYASGGTEVTQDAQLDVIEAIADALCTGFFRISRQTGWTSYAIASANGWMTSGDNHCTVAGYADWSTRELAYMDPSHL